MNRKLTAAAVSLALAPTASAMRFSFDSGVDVSLDTTVTYGLQWRVENRDPKISAAGFLADLQGDPFLPLTRPDTARRQALIINGDDGNNNFDTGLISNRLSALTDLEVRWRDVGLFVRGRAYYDTVYKDSESDLDAAGFRTYNSGTLYGGPAAIGEFPPQTRDEHGAQIEFLDAFVYGTVDMTGDRQLELRAGRQVVNWGEAVFYQGVNSIQNRVDARAANTPGVEIREILLPTGMFYAQVDLLPNLTLESYYQYEWLESELNGVGSYFSTNDQIGPGTNALLIPSPGLPFIPADIRGNEFHLRGVPRRGDVEPSDSGQWGIAFHYVTEGNTDFGVYHVVGHDKKPSVELQYEQIFGIRVPVSYRQRYYEDIRGTAASFTTVLGESNVTGELSWLDGTPLVNAAGDAEREDLLKLQLGATHVFGPNPLSDDITLSVEAFYANVMSASERDLNADDHAAGYSALAELGYNNVFPGWDLAVPAFVKHDVTGVLQELQVFRGSRVVSIGLRGTYLNNLQAGISYAAYFGGDTRNLLRDRDNIAVTFKFSF